MSAYFCAGSIFDHKFDAYVNPVNWVDVTIAR